jgi:mRNA-degrading endonuclease RelE of RelBE toxin-antitoxin system
MAGREEFTLIFAPEAIEHLDAIEAKHHAAIERAINGQLSHTPHVTTRNRKPLEPPAPFAATWELRCGFQNRFRVFYDIDHDSKAVRVLAIGIKERERLVIGGEVFRP